MLRDIHIHPVLNGFVVEVGCQQVVFTDVDDMLKELSRYLVDPETVEKRYRENALNAKHTLRTEGMPVEMARTDFIPRQGY